MAGNNKAARGGGTANAKNPLPIIIPFHRIISLKGNVGGYLGGLDKNYSYYIMRVVYFINEQNLSIKYQVN